MDPRFYQYKPEPELTMPPRHRMTTGVERIFVQTPDVGVYQEVYMHYLHFLNEETGEKIRSKLEKRIPGKLFRLLRENEQHYRSAHGVEEYEFPDGEKKLLIGLGVDFEELGFGARKGQTKL